MVAVWLPFSRVYIPVLCAACAACAATTRGTIDGASYPLCDRCIVDAVPEDEDDDAPSSLDTDADTVNVASTRERITRALARFDGGADIGELAAALGEDDDFGRAKLSAALNRMVRAGLATFTGRRMNRVYRLCEGARG